MRRSIRLHAALDDACGGTDGALVDVSLLQVQAASRSGRLLDLQPTGILAWVGTVALLIVAFLLPAILNGFPIVFPDTGGYLSAAIEGKLTNGRAAIYGALLALGIPSQFWLVIIAQAALTVWLLALGLRVHGLGGRPVRVLLVGGGLAVLTALPWFAAQLMPDIWAPAAVMSLYLLACRSSWLRRWEKLLLAVAVAFAMASHMATSALVLGLAAAIALLRLVGPRLSLPRPRLAGPMAAASLGILTALGSNLALAGKFTFTPGGINFLFARLIDTGLVARYLDDNCPDPTIRLCSYRHRLLPEVGDAWLTLGDAWLWYEQSPLYDLGGWEAFEDEARGFVIGTLVAYPRAHLRAAIDGTLAQLVMVETGDWLTSPASDTRRVIESVAPGSAMAYRTARQQQGDYDFSIDNLVHVPVALTATLLLPLVIWLARWRMVRPSVGLFAAVVLLSLVGNAVICGALANPHHRYQSRLVPLASLVVVVAALTLRWRAGQWKVVDRGHKAR